MKIEIQQNRNDLATLFKGIGVEVGTERAVFAKEIAKNATKLYCVDPFQAYRGYRDHVSQDKLDRFLQEAKERMSSFDCEFIRKFSLDAVKEFQDESLDFVYIDANHDYANCKADIEAWSKKVKIGGIVSGHDYIRRKGQDLLYGVVEAVNELNEDITIWRGDKSPSWSYIKR